MGNLSEAILESGYALDTHRRALMVEAEKLKDKYMIFLSAYLEHHLDGLALKELVEQWGYALEAYAVCNRDMAELITKIQEGIEAGRY